MSQYFAQWKDGYYVVWRNLTWAEYKVFKQRYDDSPFLNPMDVCLDIYKLIHIKGPDPDFVPAGIPVYICKQQMNNNPFSGSYRDIAPAIDMARRVVHGDFLLSAKAMIAAILHYKMEEMNDWDPTTFFVRLAQAELVSGRDFAPVDPKAPKPNGKGKARKELTPIQQKTLARIRDRNRQEN